MSTLKTLLFLLALSGFRESCHSQVINIESDYYDSISPQAFAYTISGYIEFNEGSELKIELIKIDSLLNQVVEHSFSYELDGSTISNPASFSFNAEENTFSYNAGEFAEKRLMLHLVLIRNEQAENELYYQN